MSIDVTTRPTLMDALTPVLDTLSGAGVRVTLDYKALNPPGCLLHPPTLAYRFQAGDFTATYRLWLITSATDRTQQVQNLGEQLDQVVTALKHSAVTASPVEVPTSDGTATLPGYELVWTQRIRRRTP